MSTPDTKAPAERIEFKAEIQQVLDILIHSLYTEKEIFLRELISNASDALNRFKLESLKNGEVQSPSVEQAIWLIPDKDAGTLTLRDTGIGMTQEDMVRYLGTIAHSGAKNFIESMKELNKGKASSSTQDVIGQFGVGFYSVFMIADEVTVTSRSFDPNATAAFWRSSGQGSYEVGEAEKTERGTDIVIKLKEDEKEFLEPYRLRSIIKKHSDFVAFPIYLQEEKETDGETTREFTQVNTQTALWREASRNVEDEQYEKFYQQLTFDFQKPIKTLHFSADVPIQFYALLFIPSRKDYKVFQNQDDHGLKLYARKVLIRENFKELLPPYLRFFEGVVDSEDIPLNVSREAVQATPMIQKIRRVLTNRVASELQKLAEKNPEQYKTFYTEFGQFIKEGVATDPQSHERFVDLLRFPSSHADSNNELVSLADYVSRMNDEQKDIYYVLGDDISVVQRSAHLEYFKKHELEVLYLTDPMDSFMLMGLSEYQGKALKNINDADLELPDDNKADDDTPEDSLSDDAFTQLTNKIKDVLGERIEDVRESKLLTDSACRLVNPAGAMTGNMQRMQRLMQQEYQLPKFILELNRASDIVQNLSERLQSNADDPLVPVFIEQLFENELVMEGMHPNPADMIPRIQKLMAEASKR